MQKVKYIHLVFENCESVRLDPSMFRGLWISGITKTHAVNCAQYKAGEMWTDLVSTRCGVTVNAKGLEAVTSLGNVLCKRLDYQDITHVKLVCADGTEEYISVPWAGDDTPGAVNEAQKHEWNKKRTEVEIEIRIQVK